MAAKLLLKIDEVAQSIGRPFVATVGQLCIKPNAVNVIPGEIELVLEMRDMNRDNIEYAITEIKKFANEMEAFDFVIELLIDKPNVDTDSKIMKTIEKVCLDNEIDYDIMSSGAGHDAKEMAAKVPIGMIFVPSKDGKSHCPEEYTSWEEIEVGAQVLFDTLIGLDSDV
jgi:acetylornithine deacetylase/succinyl-diaminopimelate desuccinylase-like protein